MFSFPHNLGVADKAGQLLAVLVIIGVFGVVGWGILQLLRASRRSETDRINRLTPSATVSNGNDIKTVEFCFTTYTGFGLWMIQRQQAYRLPSEQALTFLKQLHYHNLTRGLLGPGLVFIPFLSTIDYLGQKRSIQRQERTPN